MDGTFEKPVVIVSGCIEHISCRWNGLMVASDTVRALKEHVEFRPVCPEVEIGLGVPRKPVRVVRRNGTETLVQRETGEDLGNAMRGFARRFLDGVSGVDGFILKDRSPSCGIKDVKVYPPGDRVSPLTGTGSGLFGGAVAERFAHLAVESEGRLTSLAIRGHFLTRLFALASLRRRLERPSMGDLVRFHGESKLLLMAYNQTLMRQMGRVVANREGLTAEESAEIYRRLFMSALARMPRPASNINVLMHALGYFSRGLGARERAHFLETLESYRHRRVSLAVPVALVGSWIARFGEEYLAAQSYFRPYPEALADMRDSGSGR